MATTNSLCSTQGKWVYLSELSQIQARTTDARVNVSLMTDGNLAFSTSYVPNSKGIVMLYDFDKIALACMGEDVVKNFSLRIGDVYNIIVVRNYDEPDMPAEDFARERFFTSVHAERDTALDRHEFLTAWRFEGESAHVRGTYADSNGHTFDRVFSINSGTGMRRLLVSPRLFDTIDGGRLVAYTVNVGNRSMSYRVMNLPAADPAIIFRNSFGAWETFYLTGTKETAPKHERSQAVVNGRMRNYNVREEMLWTALTGPIKDGTEALAIDLARSKEVYLLNADGSNGEEIVITDCDVSYSNDADNISNFKFTWRKASRVSKVPVAEQPPMSITRLFDATFDRTFE